MLDLDPDEIDDLFEAWLDYPPPRIAMMLVARALGVQMPDKEPVDLPDGSFERAKAATEDLFKDAARFFKR